MVYRARGHNGQTIITVIANSWEQAEKEIERQLDRRGRTGYFESWNKNYRVIEKLAVAEDNSEITLGIKAMGKK